MGLNRSAVAKWKAGATPNGTTLAKMADYFGVTTDYLLGAEQTEKTPTQRGERELPHAKYREVLQENGVRLLLDADAKMSQDDLDDIVEFIKFKQRKNGR